MQKRKRVTLRGYLIRCHRCATWFHRKCTNLSLKEFHRAKRPWFCGCSRLSTSALSTTAYAKMFGCCVDDIIRTARREHPCLEFTIEEESVGKILCLDMLLEETTNRITTSWFSKPTDTGLIMLFRTCAPTRFKRNIIEGFFAPSVQHHFVLNGLPPGPGGCEDPLGEKSISSGLP